ncbi:MAG: hypothetical protein KJO54_00960 [Gammaproteobacteria bacterium]|nr:hypothetical protein [Gammaproteobacteria bacterium]
MLDVQAGEVARGSYDDALTSTGGPATVIDEATVSGGDNGSIVVSPGSIVPGESLTITVTDADLDTNATVAETVDVTASNTTTLEFETVTLTETGVNSGIFQGTLATQFGSGGANDNGVLDVQAGEVARGSYDDALTSTGGSATVTDDAMVRAGATGSITLSPSSLVPGGTFTVTVTDADLDGDPALVETVDVNVLNVSKAPADSEMVTLTETGPNTGIFSGTIPVQFGTGAGFDPTVRDEFTTAVYSNNDGSALWLGDWIENDTGGPGGGSVRITGQQLEIWSGIEGRRIYRQADLSGASVAILTLDVVNTLTSSAKVRLQVRQDGGSWTGLKTYRPGNSGVYSDRFDISAFISADTRIRFRVADDEGGSTVAFDNVQIEYGSGAPTSGNGFVDAQAGDLIQARYDDALDAAGDSVTVTDTATVSGGSDGTIDLSPASILPADPVSITVADADLDTDPGAVETVDVTLVNTTSLESETVTLTETGANTGIFASTLATAAGAGGVDDDGTMEVQSGEIIQGTYFDVLTATGDTVARSDVSIVGTFSADLRLQMIIEPPDDDTVDNAGDTVNLRLTLDNDGPGSASNVSVAVFGAFGTTMLGAAGDGLFSPAGSNGTWTLPPLPNGGSATTVVTVRIDGVGGDGAYPIFAGVSASDQPDPDSMPGSGGSAEDDAENQTILLVSDFSGAYIWRGTTNTNWNTNSNWDGGLSPPAAGARVIIPTNGANQYPVLLPAAGTLDLSTLAIAAGADLDLNGNLLSITGDLFALGPVVGSVLSTGGPARRIEGTMTSLTVDADVFTAGELNIAGNMDVVSDHFYANGQIVNVGGNFVISGGHLLMDAGGDLTIGGTVSIDQGHSHTLLRGIVRIQDDISVAGGAGEFKAFPPHTTIFTGSALDVDFLNAGGSSSNGSHFGNVVITGNTTVDFKQSPHFTGQLTVDAGSVFKGSGGNAAFFESAFPIFNGTIEPSAIDRFRLSGPITMDRDVSIYPGMRLFVEEQLSVGPHSLTTPDRMVIEDSGSLVMTDAAGLVTVNGNFSTDSGDNHLGWLTAGTIVIDGNFTQTGNGRSYAASPGHVTQFDGGTHRVFFDNANSSFGDLLLSSDPTIRIDSDAQISGQMIDSSSGSLLIHDNGAAFTLATGGVDVDGAVFDGVPLLLGDGTVTRFDNVAFTAMNPAADQLTIDRTAGIVGFNNIDFDTWPTTGTFVAGDDIGGAAGDAGVIIDNASGTARPLHGTPWSTSAGGFVINWGNPTDDSDGDGLDDAGEFANGANPLDTDTDDDGLGDNAEVTAVTPTLPNNADTDSDGAGDLQESIAGSDPLSVDPVVYIDPNATLAADGSTWASAWRDLAQADLAGDLISTGAIKFILMAEVTSASAAEWQVALDGNANNCDSLVFMGSLGDGIRIPQDNAGVPTTHLALAGAASGSVLDFEKCAGVQLHDLRITNGSGTDGGAVRLGGSAATLRGLYLDDNVAFSRGGALSLLTTANGTSSADLDDVVITNNTVTAAAGPYTGGGGIYTDIFSSITATRLRVSGNAAIIGTPAVDNGGAGLLLNGSTIDIRESLIADNFTNSRGAGLFVADQGGVSGVIRDSIVSGNRTGAIGGGVYFEQVNSAFELVNNIISGNSADNGGGIATQDSDGGGVFNNTIVYNQSRNAAATGAAVYAIDTGASLPGPAVANNIMRGNVDSVGAAAEVEAALIQSEFNITELGTYGAGDLAADPLFVSGYYLNQASSPAVDHDTSRDATARGLETRTTDVAGAPDNNAELDAGYHYAGAAPGAVGSVMIVEPSANLTGSAGTPQPVIIEPQDAAGTPLGAGLEMIVDNTSIDPVTLVPATDAEPLGAGNGFVMTDLGDGRYLIMVDTSLVALGTFTADIIVNRAAPQGIVIAVN